MNDVNGTMPEVDDDVLRQRVSSGAFMRGQRYADDGAVVHLDWDGHNLSATVAGTAPAPYRCRISIVQVGSLWIPMALGCSCPVRMGCKHTVAALISARRSGAGSEAETDWRAMLEAAAPTQEGTAPLALGFYLRPEPAPTGWRNRLQPVLSETETYERGKRLDLLLRPMTLGKSGAWVKGGLTWRGLAHELGYDHGSLMWLRQLLGLYDGTRSTNAGVDHDGLALHEIHGPMLWDLLDRAQAAGIEFVADRGMSLTLGQTATVQMRLERDEGEVRLVPRAQIDGETVTGRWHPIGRHGIYAYERTTDGFQVTIAPSTQPLPRLLASLSEPLLIPQEHEQELLEEFLPALRRVITVDAGEGIVLPEYKPPHAQLSATYGDDHRLHLEWTWEYYAPRRSHPLGDSRTGSSGRDQVWEASLLRTIGAIWPHWQGPGELEGVETAEFTTDILPRLEQVKDLRIRLSGKKPEYTRLEGHPHIRITTVESDRTDWFDLGFEITIDGQMIPFSNLFSALSRGEEKLLLIDGTFLSLEHAAFTDLKAMLARAGDLPEWEPDRPRISTYQVHFWEEFEDLADETVEAQAWRDTVASLRNIEEITSTPVPLGLKAELREYQRVGFDWLAFLHRNDLGGILADDMGLGKTLQTLTLITHAVEAGGSAPFLIIAPTSVVSTWVSEAARFTPDLTITAITRTSRKRRIPLSEVAQGADVVVTSYAIARLDAEEFHAQPWAGLILDEAQFVKNPRTRLHQVIGEIQAPFRLAITGTPMENSLTDLWSIMSIATPGLFPSPRKFREEFVRPIEKGDDPERLAQLRRMVRPFMLRRTKEQVAPELPPKQEQLLEVDLSAGHRKLYDAILQRERQKVLGLIDDLDKNRFIVFRSLTLLRMLALAPGLIDPEHENVESTKLAILIDHIADIAAEGHRVLVFSQFTSFLKMAAHACAENGVEYEYLDGSTTKRNKAIDAFRAGTAPVFFISLKAGGFGLTLTEADYVFILDPWWNPAAEAQAVDRTHRIGQTRNVMVYRMVAKDTIEEKVMALQQKKAALFNAVVEDDAHFSQALTANDIRGLFT